MAFSELSRPWRARGHSNPRGGLLLCHGFTGSPQSLRPWAEDLAAHGWDVDVPLLPGHALTWQELDRTAWQDWYGHVKEAARELSDRHGPIGIGGLSMGGALALRLAEDPELGGRVAAIVTVNPGMTLRPAALFADLIAPLVRTIPGIGSDVAMPGNGEEAYDRTPLRSVAQLRRLFAETRRDLDAVTPPLLLVTSPQDHTVPAGDSDIVAAGVRGQVERLTAPDSYHLVPLDHDAPALLARSREFFDQHVPPPAGSEEPQRQEAR